MRFLKGLFVAILAVIVMYVLLALFSPSGYSVTRELTLQSSPSEVWSQINTFEKWQKWSPWNEKDSTLVTTYSGKSGEVGSKSMWTGDSEISGSGNMTMKEITENKKLIYDLEFPNWGSKSMGSIALTKVNEGTKVTWNDAGEFPFMARPFMLLMDMEEMMGPDFERGLERLKEAVANNKATFDIETVELPVKNYIGIRHKTTFEVVMKADFYATNYAAINKGLAENEIVTTGAPVAIYYSWNQEDNSTEIVPAIPVSSGKNEIEGLESVSIPAGKALKYMYYGPYDKSESAHVAISEYAERNNIKTGLVVEEYANDPETVDSPEEILTVMYYYILED